MACYGLPIVFPLVIIAGLAAGTYLAHVAQREILFDDTPYRSRYCAVVGMFGLGTLMPAALIIWWLSPDWALMYLMNPAQLPAALWGVVWLLLYAVTPVAGFLITHRLFRSRHLWPSRVWWAGLGMGAVMTVAFGWSRLSRVTYYETFHYGADLTPLHQSTLLLPLLVTTVIVGGVYGQLVRKTRQHVAQCQSLPSLQDRPVDTVRVHNLPP